PSDAEIFPIKRTLTVHLPVCSKHLLLFFGVSFTLDGKASHAENNFFFRNVVECGIDRWVNYFAVNPPSLTCPFAGKLGNGRLDLIGFHSFFPRPTLKHVLRRML